jgi:SAM-dependent methyltransferase
MPDSDTIDPGSDGTLAGKRAQPPGDLFSGTADYYHRYRAPYPKPVFDWIINEHHLDGLGRLIDCGCGTGQVVLPLSQWFSEAIAIDPEQEMLDVAEQAAREMGVTNVRFYRMRAEDIPAEMAPLRMATFGASFHWTDRVQIGNRLYEMLEPGGGLVILAPSSIWRGEEQWKKVVHQTIRDWLGEERRAGSGTFAPGPTHELCLAQTPFSDVKSVDIYQDYVWSADTLIGLLYSTSFSSRAVLGGRVAGFEQDLRDRLAALCPLDVFPEQIEFTIISARKPR